MKPNRPSPPESDEQALWEFADAVAGNHEPTPANDLEATVVRVQRALCGPSAGSDSMPDALKAQIWENIMTTATADTNQTPIQPGKAAVFPKVGSFRRSPRRSPRPERTPPPYVHHRPMIWSGAANVALVLLIVLTGFGAWRVFDGSGGRLGREGGDDRSSLPASALQSSTPEGQGSLLEGTPSAEAASDSAAATPEPFTACDLSTDIPFFRDVEQSPVAGTSLYLVSRDPSAPIPVGDLMLHCEAEPADVLLASNVRSLGAGPWPGTVSLSLMEDGETDPSAQYPAYLDLATGTIVGFGYQPESMTYNVSHTYGSPWVLGPASNDLADFTILDLRTMETTLLSSLIGHPLPEGTRLLTAASPETTTLAVSVKLPYAAGNGDGALTDADLPGDVMIVENGVADARWITLPDSLHNVTGMWLSPDGSHLALVAPTAAGADRQDGRLQSYTYVIVSTADGAEVSRSATISTYANPSIVWVQNGDAIAYTANNQLQTLSTAPGWAPEIQFEADQELISLSTTYDPDVVVVSIMRDYGSDAPAEQTDRDAVFSVNVATGEVQEFRGRDASGGYWSAQAGFLVLFEPLADDAEALTYSVIDPVSGQVIGTITDTQTPPSQFPTIGPRSIAITPDGATEVIAFDTSQIYLMRQTDDGPVFRQIASPGWYADVPLRATIFISPDGSFLSLTGEEDEGRTRYLLQLDAETDEWVEVPRTVASDDPGYITFVEGTGDEPA